MSVFVNVIFGTPSLHRPYSNATVRAYMWGETKRVRSGGVHAHLE